jgi:hypothetical protein
MDACLTALCRLTPFWNEGRRFVALVVCPRAGHILRPLEAQNRNGVFPLGTSIMRITKTIDIEVLRHGKSDLLMAFSQALPGLLVSGRSQSEIDDKLPGAIRQLLEAEGNENITVTVQPDPNDLPPAFTTPKFKANISLDHTT